MAAVSIGKRLRRLLYSKALQRCENAPVGQVCCNESCGICALPGGACTQQICDGESEGMVI